MTAGDGEVPPVDVWTRLIELGELLDKVSTRLEIMTRAQAVDRASGRKTRRLAIGLAVSIALDVVLTAVVTLLTVTALNQNAVLHASQLASCATSNDTRAEQRQLWAYVFQISGPPKTAAARTQEQKFLAFVDTTFAPVNCAAVYRG